MNGKNKFLIFFVLAFFTIAIAGNVLAYPQIFNNRLEIEGTSTHNKTTIKITGENLNWTKIISENQTFSTNITQQIAREMTSDTSMAQLLNLLANNTEGCYGTGKFFANYTLKKEKELQLCRENKTSLIKQVGRLQGEEGKYKDMYGVCKEDKESLEGSRWWMLLVGGLIGAGIIYFLLMRKEKKKEGGTPPAESFMSRESKTGNF